MVCFSVVGVIRRLLSNIVSHVENKFAVIPVPPGDGCPGALQVQSYYVEKVLVLETTHYF